MIATVDAAWELFTGRVLENARADAHGKMDRASAALDDDALATFVREHPGHFEERFLAGIPELALPRWPERELVSGLDVLTSIGVSIEDHAPPSRRGPLDATLRALDPRCVLEVCRLVVWRYHLEWPLELDAFIRRLPQIPTPPELPPEMCDDLRRWLGPRSTPLPALPDVLPHDLDGWSPRDIERALEAYVGVPIESIEARLCARKHLTSGERLGPRIWQDASELRRLGVPRQALASRIEEGVRALNAASARAFGDPPTRAPAERHARYALSKGWQRVGIEGEGGLEIEIKWGGHWSEDNPFHTMGGEALSGHVEIRNPRLPSAPDVQCSEVAIHLLRRFCFFDLRGGERRERIAPEIAARTLGLV